MNKYRLYILIAAFSLFAACRARKEVLPATQSDEAKPMQDRSVQSLMDSLDKHQFNAEWISGKANVSTVSDGNETSFNINLRMKRDSAIWISISPLLGIEVARVMITQDSVKFIDRLHKKYQSGSIEYINKLLQLKVNFEAVQALLWGNFFAYKKNENRFNSVYIEEKFYILSSLNKRKLKRSLEEMDPGKPLIQDVYVDGSNYRITSVEVEDQRIGKHLTCTYDDFRITPAGVFPFKSKTLIKAEKDMEIQIEFGKISVGEKQEFPFNIPADYERTR